MPISSRENLVGVKGGSELRPALYVCYRIRSVGTDGPANLHCEGSGGTPSEYGGNKKEH